jgi:hypothetical protein
MRWYVSLGSPSTGFIRLVIAGFVLPVGLLAGSGQSRAREEHYPALGLTLPASPEAGSSGLPVSDVSPLRPNPNHSGKLRGVTVASTESQPSTTPRLEPVVQSVAHAQYLPRSASPPTSRAIAAQLPTAKLPTTTTPAAASGTFYTPRHRAAVTSQPAVPPPAFTGSCPPLGTSPPGMWLVRQFWREVPESRPTAEDHSTGPISPTVAAVHVATPTLGEDFKVPQDQQSPPHHRLASHQQTTSQPAPVEPESPSVPPVVVAPLPPVIVENDTSLPAAVQYQPVLWPNYLECRLMPSCQPACRPVCRPCRPLIPTFCPCP